MAHRIGGALIPGASSVLGGHLGVITLDSGTMSYRVEGALIPGASSVLSGHLEAIT